MGNHSISASSASTPAIASAGFSVSHENSGSALAAATAAPAIMPVLNSDMIVLAVCVYAFLSGRALTHG